MRETGAQVRAPLRRRRLTIWKAIASGGSAAGIADLDELGRLLLADTRSDLARTVTETMTINETSFFRDRALFTALSDRLLPQLLAAREATRRIRIWCAGCSTGQEPYSIAMVLDEQMRRRQGWQVEILATDLSRTVIEQAQRGVYSQFEVQRGLPVSQLLRHFNRRSDRWQISDYLRAKVTFRRQNLMSIPSDMSEFDMIFCRNVLFYFEADTKRRVLQRLSSILASDGFLALGGAERITDLCPSLEADRTGPYVFKRRLAYASETDRSLAKA